jgi:AraC-like DNA-binding protein
MVSSERQLVRHGIAARLADGSGFTPHAHPAHQLAWTTGEGVRIAVGGATWMLSDRTALWIPAGLEHCVDADRSTVLRSLYFLPDGCPVRWAQPTPVRAEGLAKHLFEHLLDADAGPTRRRAERVLFDLLEPVASVTVRLPWPTDDRAVRVAEALDRDPADGRTLAAWGMVVGASARTLARAFERDTELRFAEWRTHLRIAHAARRLAAGERVGRVGTSVGYATASAFVAAFRRVVGMTPGAYCAAPPVDGGTRARPEVPLRSVAAGVHADVRGDFVFAYADRAGDTLRSRSRRRGMQ